MTTMDDVIMHSIRKHRCHSLRERREKKQQVETSVRYDIACFCTYCTVPICQVFRPKIVLQTRNSRPFCRFLFSRRRIHVFVRSFGPIMCSLFFIFILLEVRHNCQRKQIISFIGDELVTKCIGCWMLMMMTTTMIT